VSRSFSRIVFGLVMAFFLIALAPKASAQLDVTIQFARSLYMVYEPIICSVVITNHSGQDLQLSDSVQDKWFGFDIQTTDGRPLPPVNGGYKNESVEIGAGQTLRRPINLTPLYPLSEFGTYRVKASIYDQRSKRYYSSGTLNIEITEGRLLWQQVVGVPEGATGTGERTVSLLAHRLPNTTMLYIRIEDKEAGVIYCTHQLGRFLAFGAPDIMLDHANQVHILQNTAPKTYLYSEIGLNGEVIKRQAYQDGGVRPRLVKSTAGEVAVLGGVAYDPNAPPPEQKLPKLSDRPVPLPTPQGAATPEEKRPKNLLSE